MLAIEAPEAPALIATSEPSVDLIHDFLDTGSLFS
jgi:hypothetical protein